MSQHIDPTPKEVTLESLSNKIGSLIKNEVITFTTNTAGNYSFGTSWGLTKRLIVGIYGDRSDSDYDITASFFTLFTASNNASNGNITVRVSDSAGEAKVSTDIKARIYYIELK